MIWMMGKIRQISQTVSSAAMLGGGSTLHIAGLPHFCMQKFSNMQKTPHVYMQKASNMQKTSSPPKISNNR